ncbi:MAG: hypothetical protein ACOZQL_26390 [Myxococcota bacterium]
MRRWLVVCGVFSACTGLVAELPEVVLVPAADAGASTVHDAGSDAGSTPPPDAGSSIDAGATDLDAGAYFRPNPLLSLGAPVVASSSTASTVAKAFDNRLDTGDWEGPPPGANDSISDMWVRVQIGSGTPCVGPSQVLLVWSSLGNPDYTIERAVNYNSPTGYTIETSSDGMSWTTAVSVDDSTTTYRSRSHRFDTAGKCFVRFTVTRMATGQSGRRPRLAEVALYDVSNGNDDTWIFLGNGPSRFAYDGHFHPGFSAAVTRRHPRYTPAVIDAAELPGSLDFLLGAIDDALLLNPGMHHWVIAAGLEELSAGVTPAQAQFKPRLATLIQRIKSAGHEPMLVKLRYSTASQFARASDYNAIIDQLVAEHGLTPAPDLYTFFATHHELLCSSTSDCEPQWMGISPSDPDGYIAENQQWADALDAHYAP